MKNLKVKFEKKLDEIKKTMDQMQYLKKNDINEKMYRSGATR